MPMNFDRIDPGVALERANARANMLALSQIPFGMNGLTLWAYRSDLDLSTVRAPQFFADASHKMMKRGDFILVAARDGGAMLFVSDVKPGMVQTASMGSCFAPILQPLPGEVDV